MQSGPVGFCVVQRPATRDSADYEPLQQFRTCDIADAMRGSHTMHGIRPAYHPISRVVGPAITVSLPGSGFQMINAAMLQGKPGDILVIATHGAADAAYWGGDITELAMGLGLSGVIVDGAIRDRDQIQQAGFPAFSRTVATRAAVVSGSWGEINMPVACGGIAVSPGDIVVADEHGVVAIPPEWLERAIHDTQELTSAGGHLPPLADVERHLLAEGLLVIRHGDESNGSSAI